MRADINKGGGERPRTWQQVTNHHRRDNARAIAERVEHAARRTDDFPRCCVRENGPAQRAETLAEECETHQADYQPLRVHVVAEHHTRTEHKAEDYRSFPGD